MARSAPAAVAEPWNGGAGEDKRAEGRMPGAKWRRGDDSRLPHEPLPTLNPPSSTRSPPTYAPRRLVASRWCAADKAGKKPKRSARELLDAKEPVEHTFPISLKSRYRDALTEAEQALTKLESRYRLNLIPGDVDWPAMHAEAEAAVEAAKAELEENSQEFAFRALGRKQLGALVKKHRPTDEEVKEFQRLAKLNPATAANGELPYNQVTLPPELIQLACIDPVFSFEEAQELWDSDSWSDAELAMILNAAWAVNKLIK